MNIALIGATGFVGAAILQEALNRGHEVTAIVRNPEQLQAHPKLRAAKRQIEKAIANYSGDRLVIDLVRVSPETIRSITNYEGICW